MKKQPLSYVAYKCRSAPAVWLALLEIANEKNRRLVWVSRDQISLRSRVIRLATVSKCLKALDEAGWIVRKTVRFSKAGQFRSKIKIRFKKAWKFEKLKPSRRKAREGDFVQAGAGV